MEAERRADSGAERLSFYSLEHQFDCSLKPDAQKSSADINAQHWPPADKVPVEIGVEAIAGARDAPVTASRFVIIFPDADCDGASGRCDNP